ncbi:DUF2142 domain-containing protein (plasmid) [Azospirillum argentinense]|uniref:DUF2142 domain-containing protein n=1 Tax=Azospirillum argentinense TaxID=2970906 RepID=A0A4D8PU47_9PROT|nr:DUF2142 domain-containing protein [Azospirillum argentinense]
MDVLLRTGFAFQRVSEASVAILARLERGLPLLFLAYALPMVIFLSITMPAYLNPDETNHAMRAEQVSHGAPLNWRTGPFDAGGTIDTGLLSLLEVYWPILAEADKRVTRSMQDRSHAVTWSGNRMFANTPNTAVYPPTLYLPVTVAIWIGKAAKLPVETTLILGRLINGAVAASLTALAIALAARGRFVIFATMLLPMSLAQFASCSQDALLLSGGALLAALLSRPMCGRRPATGAEYLGAAVLVALLSMSRPTNLVFILPLLLPSVAPRLTGRFSALTVVGGAVAATLAWIVWVAIYVQVPQPHSGIVPMMGDQLRHLIADPLSLFTVLWNTALMYTHGYYVMMIAFLGWGQAAFTAPSWFYILAGVVLLLACATEVLGPPGLTRRQLAVAWLSVGASFLGILVIQYLSFSRVGGTFVEGVQGRYFLPLAAAAGLLMPAIAAPAALRLATAVPVLVFPIATLLTVPTMVIGRFYLQAG